MLACILDRFNPNNFAACIFFTPHMYMYINSGPKAKPHTVMDDDGEFPHPTPQAFVWKLSQE